MRAIKTGSIIIAGIILSACNTYRYGVVKLYDGPLKKLDEVATVRQSADEFINLSMQIRKITNSSGEQIYDRDSAPQKIVCDNGKYPISNHTHLELDPGQYKFLLHWKERRYCCGSDCVYSRAGWRCMSMGWASMKETITQHERVATYNLMPGDQIEFIWGKPGDHVGGTDKLVSKRAPYEGHGFYAYDYNLSSKYYNRRNQCIINLIPEPMGSD